MDKLSQSDIERLKYVICCPMCDNDKCVRRTDTCEAEQWARRKKEELERRTDGEEVH